MFCAWEEPEAWGANEPDDWRMGDDGKLPVEDCLHNSKDISPLPERVGIPTRSENGWPNASQSFSTSACTKKKDFIIYESHHASHWVHNWRARQMISMLPSHMDKTNKNGTATQEENKI